MLVGDLFVPGGTSGTGFVGTVTLAYDKNVSVTGVVGTSAIGVATSAVVPTATGVIASGEIGAIITVYGGSITPTGVSGTGAVGTINRVGWNTIDDSQTPNWVDIAA